MADIRSKGILEKWFEDKGFGFITSEHTNTTIFIHISSFDKNISRRPKVGDTIFYYSQTDDEGKIQAVDAVIEGVSLLDERTYSHQKRKLNKRNRKNSLKSTFMIMLLIIGLGGFAFTRIESGTTLLSISGVKIAKKTPQKQQSVSNFRCDGRTRCTEMRSCKEALFFLQNCPNTKMDGDRDGVPCERQWCK